MDSEEARRRVSTDWVKTYQYAYNQMKFIEDEQARVRAVNGFMVTIDKVIPFNVPVTNAPVPEFETADKVDQPTKQESFTEEGPIGPAYDKVNKRWNYCPECKSIDINHISGPQSRRPGAEYQGCFTCRLYLNIDEEKKPMPKPKVNR